LGGRQHTGQPSGCTVVHGFKTGSEPYLHSLSLQENTRGEPSLVVGKGASEGDIGGVVKLNGETTQEKLDDHCATPRASQWDWKVKKPGKLKKGRRKMVLAGDIGLEESCNLAMCALVGKFTYRAMR
jgi:hypothetical protein